MNGEVFQITADQMVEFNAPEAVEYAAGMSSHILIGVFGAEILCVIGFIPKTFLSDTAYVWLHILEAGDRHKFMVARRASQVIERALAIYPHIIGHCFTKISRRWLTSLGAIFLTEDTFEIRRG